MAIFFYFMIQALLGQKLNQTQKFLQDGRRIPVTQVSVADNIVLQVKNMQKDQYVAVQLGYGAKKHGSKALIGHLKKAGVNMAPAVIKEVSLQNAVSEDLPKVGDLFTVDAVFKPGDTVDVTGTSKGKGFAGVVKRHNFRGGPKTHGQSDRERAPGSIGQTTTPGRVYRGKRMAGRMGGQTKTVTNLTIVDVDAKNKTLSILGLVPGHKQSVFLITQRGTDKKFVPLLGFKEAEEVTPEVVEVEAQVADATPEVVEEVVQPVEAAPEVVEAKEDKAEEVKEAEEVVSETVEEVKEEEGK